MKGRIMNLTLYSAAKWAGAIVTLTILGGWMSDASIRLHKMEEETKKVAGNRQQIKIITLYLKLQDPDLYQRAEELAK